MTFVNLIILTALWMNLIAFLFKVLYDYDTRKHTKEEYHKFGRIWGATIIFSSVCYLIIAFAIVG